MSFNNIDLQLQYPDNLQDFFNCVQEKVHTQIEFLLEESPVTCKNLYAALRYMALSGGKLLRPALLFTLVERPQNLLLATRAATALELIHTYSLVHDDLPAMDNDELRRGQPSCHIKFGEATAILVGDALQSMAFELLSNPDLIEHNLDATKHLKIINILAKAIGPQGMIAGQSLEFNPKLPFSNYTIEDLNEIHALKTGKLFLASLQIGAVVADFTSVQYDIITNLGKTLGLAFQIQDDILDLTQSSATLGKPSQSDYQRGIPTYATIIDIAPAQAILSDLWKSSKNLITELESTSNKKFTILTKLLEHIAARQS